MSFLDVLKERIKAAPFRSREKDVLRTLLGDIQQREALRPQTDEACMSTVKSFVKNIDDTLAKLNESDSRRAGLEEERKVLTALLPKYWTAYQIKTSLEEANLMEAILSAPKSGQATGIAMKHLKAIKAPVEGDTVSSVIEQCRAAAGGAAG